MLSYIIRRVFYSLLVVAGVLLLTFVLFSFGAGDPAAAVLGKNARPVEVESLRRELGGDLPLLFGRHCRTEAFKAARPLKPADKLTVRREFDSMELIAKIKLSDGTVIDKTIPAADVEFTATAPQGKRIESVDFFRLQESPWNSRFLRSIQEIIQFKSEFPYVEFFDFGRTLTTREPIRRILWRGVWPSLALMLPVFFGELLFGIILALVAAAFCNRWPDRFLVLFSVAGLSISYLVMIIFGQWFLGYYLELFPIWGYDGLRSFGLPLTIGILCGVGANVRFFRTVFLDELRREYLRTAVAKGGSPWHVYGRHLLRNAMIQIITRASAGLPFLFTGSLLLESFFGIPGLGFAGVEALYNSDIQLLKALVVLSALLFVVINLLADLAYGWVDPRVRLE